MCAKRSSNVLDDLKNMIKYNEVSRIKHFRSNNFSLQTHKNRPNKNDVILKSGFGDVIITQKPSIEQSKRFMSDSMSKGEVRNKNQLAHRIVHLDLKGASPRIEYLKDLLPYLKEMGATGLLIEYEDSFPYWGSISSISSRNCYSKEDIKLILEMSKANSLEVIPLIQSLGHMESVLKLEKFSMIREVPSYPQVSCPTNNQTYVVIRTIIEQIMELHPDINWLHIGADEVFNLGDCLRCRSIMAANQWGKVR